MATIQELKQLTQSNETQNGPSDRITGAEVRQVDNAVIDELGRRGLLTVAGTANLSTMRVSETGNVMVPNSGIFTPLATASAPDNINTFPSPDTGYVWQRTLDVVYHGFYAQDGHIVAGDREVFWDEQRKGLKLNFKTWTPSGTPSTSFVSFGKQWDIETLIVYFNNNNPKGGVSFGLVNDGGGANRGNTCTMTMYGSTAKIINGIQAGFNMRADRMPLQFFTDHQNNGNAKYPIEFYPGVAWLTDISAVKPSVSITPTGMITNNEYGVYVNFNVVQDAMFVVKASETRFYPMKIFDSQSRNVFEIDPAGGVHVKEQNLLVDKGYLHVINPAGGGDIQITGERITLAAGAKMVISNTTPGKFPIQITQPQTPTAPQGEAGDIAWDDNNIYIKTVTGWKKTALVPI